MRLQEILKYLQGLQALQPFGYEDMHWSDTKTIYPMLPKNSDVQKCPGCGKYYFLADAKTLPSGEDPHRRLMNRLFDLLESEDKQV